MEQSVPSTSATRVESAAICTDVINDGARPFVAARRAYHLSDHSGDGRVNTAEEPNDTATVTMSGVSRKITAPAATTQTATTALCSILVTRSSRGAEPARPSRPR